MNIDDYLHAAGDLLAEREGRHRLDGATRARLLAAFNARSGWEFLLASFSAPWIDLLADAIGGGFTAHLTGGLAMARGLEQASKVGAPILRFERWSQPRLDICIPRPTRTPTRLALYLGRQEAEDLDLLSVETPTRDAVDPTHFSIDLQADRLYSHGPGAYSLAILRLPTGLSPEVKLPPSLTLPSKLEFSRNEDPPIRIIHLILEESTEDEEDTF